ncbi:hypothetical protein SAMN05892877_101461 [Rhizobium subbaraonis]|uniref:DUF305 domain-containing protein n=1 Tax=Rhizobium subbaraonis TaxID=908946 RepID=A0A285U2J4_9HYPH|nr:DUF305 domain-containing protein [Rhizobium subbaraonis]SOC35648.1 hypothetical protein SAMN05892877_101461 [Rhizobium subbaraonis]
MTSWTKMIVAAAVPLVVLAVPSPSSAQMALPDKCKADMATGQAMQMPEMQMGNMAEHQKAMMEGMREMHPAMMQGMMAKDPDVAFVCGMIAHHMGAISMSEVELKFGDDAEAKSMAEKIIDAQKKEIDEMTTWINEHAQ